MARPLWHVFWAGRLLSVWAGLQTATKWPNKTQISQEQFDSYMSIKRRDVLTFGLFRIWKDDVLIRKKLMVTPIMYYIENIIGIHNLYIDTLNEIQIIKPIMMKIKSFEPNTILISVL